MSDSVKIPILSGRGRIQKHMRTLLNFETTFLHEKSEKIVREILHKIARDGDKALFAYTKQFDGVSLNRKSLRVMASEFLQASKKTSAEFKRSLALAEQRILAYHKEQDPFHLEYFSKKIKTGLRVLPIASVGIYVPGGEAPLFSTVLMNSIPAHVAGVPRVVMVTPPRPDGSVEPHILFTAQKVGIHEIYKIGGAQAIAALAYGTSSIPRVDKIVGPGNIFVTFAKRFLFGTVGIDKLAGPSEVVILADDTARPEWVAADLLAQAEHDPLAISILVTPSKRLAREVQRALREQCKALFPHRQLAWSQSLKSSAIYVVKNLHEGIEVVNGMAPEHLGLMVKSPRAVLKKIQNAGAVFLGGYSPQALGDYIAGPNHVLPTGATARFSSPLTVFDFVKFQSVVDFSRRDLRAVATQAQTLARLEGLEAHARALSSRFH